MPENPRVVWRRPLAGPGLGGVAASSKYVVIGDRDLDNFSDVFRCFDAATGQPLWMFPYPAIGDLDYGNSPRATPLIHGDHVYTFGAFGDLHCLRLDSGRVVWSKSVRLEFAADDKLVWGTCSSPLIADNRLIVNPGTSAASLVALAPTTGRVLWQTPGEQAAFGSLIYATLGGVQQIVGHDRVSLGGWDVKTGRRLWRIEPPNEGDFNVPTPVVVGDRLLVTTENNGTRLYAFEQDGRIRPEPIAQNDDLAPDMSTPVFANGRLFGVWGALYCLDPQRGLQPHWTARDKAFGNYAALIGGNDRVLVIGNGGELVLVDAAADTFQVISRCSAFDGSGEEFYSHPAIVGQKLYIRGAEALLCLDLSQNEAE